MKLYEGSSERYKVLSWYYKSSREKTQRTAVIDVIWYPRHRVIRQASVTPVLMQSCFEARPPLPCSPYDATISARIVLRSSS